MKFVVERKRLLAAAKKAIKATGVATDKSKNAIEGILLEAYCDKQMLKLSATNFSTGGSFCLSLQIKIRNADVSEDGAAIIPAKLFIGMLGALDGEQAAVTMNNNIMMLQSGNPIFTFATADAAEFPKIAVPISEEMTRVKGICAITEKAKFATETNTGIPEHEGVYLRLSDSISSAAATNGKTYIKSCDSGMADGELEVFIPARAIQILSSTLNPEDEIYAGIKSNCVTFLGQDFIFCSRILNADLKRIENTVEKINPQYHALVKAEELASALDMCLGMNLDSNKCVDISFDDSSVRLSDVNKSGSFNMLIDNYYSKTVSVGEKTSNSSKVFHYDPSLIYKYAKNCKDMVLMSADESGILKITENKKGGAETTYIVCPRNARKPQSKETKANKKDKKGKVA